MKSWKNYRRQWLIIYEYKSYKLQGQFWTFEIQSHIWENHLRNKWSCPPSIFVQKDPKQSLKLRNKNASSDIHYK